MYAQTVFSFTLSFQGSKCVVKYHSLESMKKGSTEYIKNQKQNSLGLFSLLLGISNPNPSDYLMAAEVNTKHFQLP